MKRIKELMKRSASTSPTKGEKTSLLENSSQPKTYGTHTDSTLRTEASSPNPSLQFQQQPIQHQRSASDVTPVRNKPKT